MTSLAHGSPHSSTRDLSNKEQSQEKADRWGWKEEQRGRRSPVPKSLPPTAGPSRANLFQKTRAWVCVEAAVVDSRLWGPRFVSAGKQ